MTATIRLREKIISRLEAWERKNKIPFSKHETERKKWLSQSIYKIERKKFLSQSMRLKERNSREGFFFQKWAGFLFVSAGGITQLSSSIYRGQSMLDLAWQDSRKWRLGNRWFGKCGGFKEMVSSGNQWFWIQGNLGKEWF